MKWLKPPFWAWLTSQSTWMILGATGAPSSVVTSGPIGVTATISPSPRISTFLVCGITAVMSEARKNSSWHMPSTSGAFIRAPIRRSGSSRDMIPSAYAPVIRFRAPRTAVRRSSPDASSIRWGMTSLSVSDTKM